MGSSPADDLVPILSKLTALRSLLLELGTQVRCGSVFVYTFVVCMIITLESLSCSNHTLCLKIQVHYICIAL